MNATNSAIVAAWLESQYRRARQLENLASHVAARGWVSIFRYLLLRDKPPLKGCRP